MAGGRMGANLLMAAGMAAATLLSGPGTAQAQTRVGGIVAADVSSQSRQAERPRIRVTPRRGGGPLRRECVPVFTERMIPEWGGRVLYASQRCWWTTAPL